VLLANSIHGSGGQASFAFLPYSARPEFRTVQKVVLDKALILLACVRYGQHYATYGIKWPAAIIRKLLESSDGLKATTEAKSQYATAAQAQIVRLEQVGSWYRPVLIDTPDNIAAGRLALDLLEHGESLTMREDPEQKLLFTGGQYLTPLMTMKEHKPRTALSGDLLLTLTDTIRGER
jgi:hypothetical protein